MQCAICKRENPVEAKFCNHCGGKTENTDKTCTNPTCSRTGMLPPEARFCPDCGFPVEIILPPIDVSVESTLPKEASPVANPGNQKTKIFASFTETANELCFDMVAVNGGTFEMGQPNPDIYSTNHTKDEQPPHQVRVNNFYICKTPVTVGMFKAFIDATSYRTNAETSGGSQIYIKRNLWYGIFIEFKNKPGANWRYDAKGNVRNGWEGFHPVIHVSWNDVVAFCNWLKKQTGKAYRLPSEAEWEYAAGGDSSNRTTWAGTNDGDQLGNYAWYEINSNDETPPVGSLKPNVLGIFDMSGNVYEWCEDWYDKDYYANSPKNNPKGPITGTKKVIRGGCFYEGDRWCRVADRDCRDPGDRYGNIGFRLVMDP